jgi:predicted lysophospholipase L1 biosynthesis ABC-type transport system permease subunit
VTESSSCATDGSGTEADLVLRVTLASRMAWRDARREWRVSVLLLAVVAAVIGTCTAYLTVSHNDDLSLDQRIHRALGGGDARVTVALDSDASPTVDSLLGRPDVRDGLAGASVTPVVDMASNARVGDRAIGIKLELLDTSSGLTAPLFVSRSGTRPSSDAEVAVSQEAATRLGLAVGSTLAVSGFSQPLSVVQILADPVDTRSLFVIARLSDDTLREALSKAFPGSLSVTYLVDGTSSQLQASGLGYLDRQGVIDRAQATTSLTAPLIAGAVLATAVVTTAGFLTVSRRQRRTAGLLDLAGADFATRLATLLVAGLLVALLGCVVGVVIGVGAAEFLLPRLAARAHQVWSPARVPGSTNLSGV